MAAEKIIHCDRCKGETKKLVLATWNVTITHPAMRDSTSRSGIKTFTKNLCDNCVDYMQVNWPKNHFFVNGKAFIA